MCIFCAGHKFGRQKRDFRYLDIGDLSTFFKYPEEVRWLIYTTNSVEGFHRMLRKYTKTKTTYPSDEAVKKSVYLSIDEITKKWSMPVRDWGIIMGQLSIFFEERLSQVKSA